MALDFVRSPTQHCKATFTATLPLTLACWLNLDSVTNDVPIWVGAEAVGHFDAFYLNAYPNGATWLYAVSAANNVFASAFADANPANGTWFHVCGVFASTALRTCYVNGGSAGSNATVSNPSTHHALNTVYVGASGHISPPTAGFVDGRIADVAIWNAALTADEVGGLGRGVNPLAVRPDNLVRYWPLGLNGNDVCWRTGIALTRVNGPVAVAANPPTSRMRF